MNDPFEPLLEDRVSQSRRVARALEHLPADVREIVKAMDSEGKSLAQLAHDRGMDERALRSALQPYRDRLWKELRDLDAPMRVTVSTRYRMKLLRGDDEEEET